jgi:hypothetical protein
VCNMEMKQSSILRHKRTAHWFFNLSL